MLLIVHCPGSNMSPISSLQSSIIYQKLGEDTLGRIWCRRFSAARLSLLAEKQVSDKGTSVGQIQYKAVSSHTASSRATTGNPMIILE